MTHTRKIPTTEKELWQRANSIAGLSLAELADTLHFSVPANLRREKGWIGQLIEACLGAHAASKPEPDFPILGIELKTIPINNNGQPYETTFVSTIPLLKIGQQQWHDSIVYRKLKHVLWIPIVSEKNMSVGEYIIASPLLWRPSAQQEHILRQDWEELRDMLSLGQLEQITAKHGHYLQVRPKGANAKSLCWGIGSTGEPIQTLPRGFYLRTSFTREILKENYAI